MSKLLSIVIPATRPELLSRCLSTIYSQNYDNYEVIISANDNRGEIKKVADTVARYYGPRGFVLPVETCVKYNIYESWDFAVAHASGQYTLILGDDDAIVDGGLKLTADTIIANNYPDYVSPAFAWYGHAGINDARGNALRVDTEWQIEGFTDPKKQLEELFKLRRSCFSPTHCWVKTYDYAGAELENLFAAQYPDYFWHAIMLARAKTCYLMRQPTLIHGYAVDSSAELLMTRRDIANKWVPAPRLSPVKAHVYINGWLETLLNLKKQYPHWFAHYIIDWPAFYAKYAVEIGTESCYQDCSEYFDELMAALVAYNVNHPELPAVMAQTKRVIDAKLWQDNRAQLLNQWLSGNIFGFETIEAAAKKVTDIWQKKIDLTLETGIK